MEVVCGIIWIFPCQEIERRNGDGILDSLKRYYYIFDYHYTVRFSHHLSREKRENSTCRRALKWQNARCWMCLRVCSLNLLAVESSHRPNDLLGSTFPEKIVVVEQQSHIWGGKEGKETAT